MDWLKYYMHGLMRTDFTINYCKTGHAHQMHLNSNLNLSLSDGPSSYKIMPSSSKRLDVDVNCVYIYQLQVFSFTYCRTPKRADIYRIFKVKHLLLQLYYPGSYHISETAK